jgi:hypothetical protein
VGLKLYRHDTEPTIPHPHYPRPARKTDHKHAQ